MRTCNIELETLLQGIVMIFGLDDQQSFLNIRTFLQGIVMIFGLDDQQSFLNIRTWLQNIEDVSATMLNYVFHLTDILINFKYPLLRRTQ